MAKSLPLAVVHYNHNSFQAEHGFINLTGVDYSAGAVSLAQSVAAKEGHNITYLVRNNSSAGPKLVNKFAVF